MTNVPMNKEQVLKDLTTLESKFQQVHKYYNLSDKEIIKGNFNDIINDLKEYLTETL